MPKHTSKSVSERQRTSSVSGTSGKMVATGWIRKARKEVSKDSQFGYLLAGLDSRPRAERVTELVEAGILTKEKKLASKYKFRSKKPKVAGQPG